MKHRQEVKFIMDRNTARNRSPSSNLNWTVGEIITILRLSFFLLLYLSKKLCV